MVSIIKNIRKVFSSNGGGGGGTPLPYTPEDVANKSTSVVTDQASDIKYPSVKAVYDWATSLFQTSLGFTPENVSNKATNFSTVNDTLYPTVKAVNDHIDSKLVGLWDDRGSIDASFNLFPMGGGSGTSGAIVKGDIWTVSVVGILGGVTVNIGDTVRALVNSPGQTPTNWSILENNIGYVPENVANKVTTMTGNTGSNTLYLSAKAIYDWATGLFLQKNTAITGATKTKITYDTNGLVTSGADATTADIADSSNKRYVTDAQLVVIGNTSGTNTGDQTFIAPRLQTVTSATTVTPTSNNDVVVITAQAVGLTLANPTGSPVQGQSMLIKIKDNGVSRTIAFDTMYRAVNTTLPVSTTISKVLYIALVYNSDDAKWDVVGVALEGASPSTVTMDVLQIQVFS